MSNLYDVLYTPLRPERKLAARREKLAQALAASGRIRLDADNESNFIRLLLPQQRINLTFTSRELQPPLDKQSFERIKQALQPRNNPEQAHALTEKFFEKALADIKKRRLPSAQTELMTARCLACCNARAVIELLHREGAEIFISFGHSVSDVMDIATWQDVGESNGLQAYGQGQNAVYVSCGGHPFLDDSERTYHSDGFPALARFLVIAAQETGHNADMTRNASGQKTGRYSSLDWGRMPHPKVSAWRLADLKRTRHASQQAERCGLNRIVEWERHLSFYRTHKLYDSRWFAAWLKSKLGWLVFCILMQLQGLGGVTRLQRDSTPATLLRSCFRDMIFNIHPLSDAYRRPDPNEQEAMLCIEALARVPQQAVKWGPHATRTCMPHLYRLYYRRIVPACTKALSRYKAN